MFVELAGEPGRERSFDIVIPGRDMDLDLSEIELEGNVKAHLALTETADGARVGGQIAGTVSLPCIRCLKPVSRVIDLDFEAKYLTADPVSEVNDHEVAADDLDAEILTGNGIDLSAAVREQIILDLPDAPLCREDCRGLCPKCGEDRNLIDCKCKDDEIDPRWAALKDLK